MKSELRIPTILGLGVLLIGLGAGVFLVSQNQAFKSRASQSDALKKVTIVNISTNSATVYWQTDKEATGFIQAGPTSKLGLVFNDERDGQNPQKHRIHFVNLTNLTPNTTYYLKAYSGASSYPNGEPLSFKTTDFATLNNLKPLIGTVVDATLNPVNEALVTLETGKTEKITAITKSSGNFILPLTFIPQEFIPSDSQENISARLTVTDPSQQTSVVTLKIPYSDTTMPPIILGKNIDITPPPPTTSPTPPVKYDLNNDGAVNSFDRSIIQRNFGPTSEAGKKPKQKEADLNNDGVVDKKDLDLISQFVPPDSTR